MTTVIIGRSARAGGQALAPAQLIDPHVPPLVRNHTKIIAFAAQHRLPTVYGKAYYTSIVDAWRRLPVLPRHKFGPQ
jgi:hypothetical protein